MYKIVQIKQSSFNTWQYFSNVFFNMIKSLHYNSFQSSLFPVEFLEYFCFRLYLYKI